jgi:hypothetical protein
MRIKEISRGTKWEKLGLILPFIVLIIDAEMFYYAFLYREISIVTGGIRLHFVHI